MCVVLAANLMNVRIACELACLESSARKQPSRRQRIVARLLVGGGVRDLDQLDTMWTIVTAPHSFKLVARLMSARRWWSNGSHDELDVVMTHHRDLCQVLCRVHDGSAVVGVLPPPLLLLLLAVAMSIAILTINVAETQVISIVIFIVIAVIFMMVVEVVVADGVVRDRRLPSIIDQCRLQTSVLERSQLVLHMSIDATIMMTAFGTNKM